MADLARENSLDADVSAPGKRDIEQIADAQAEPPKRARMSESTAEPAAQPEEDATPFSRGVALAEIDIKRNADKERADGRTELADAIEATIVTSAAQREAALVPRPPPENESGGAQRRRRMKELQAERHRNEGDEVQAAVCLLTSPEIAEWSERMDEFSQVLTDYTARVRAARLTGRG